MVMNMQTLDGLQSTHSHSKGYISFPYSLEDSETQGHLKVNGSSGIFSFSKNVLVFFYCQHFIMKIFKDTVKLKEFYSEPRFLESIISILLCLLSLSLLCLLINPLYLVLQSKLKTSYIPP